ncbi:MAG: BTAD domain-containing putative transcriptional regulator [Anaerolineae bacterium]
MQYSGHTLDATLLKLLPGVFFHPVWTRFVKLDTPVAPEQIQLLSSAADQMLAAGKLDDTCQTLFVVAVQQLRAGDYTSASSSIQRILLLAEQHGLVQVTWWATWGAAAVCVRRGWFRQAAEHLEHLQTLLGQQHEWVLSGMIDVIRQSLLDQSAVAEVIGTEPTFSPPLDAVLMPAVEQLLHWGEPSLLRGARVMSTELEIKSPVSGSIPARFRSYWRHLRESVAKILKGELRLQWVDTIELRQNQLLDRLHDPRAPLEIRAPHPVVDHPLLLVPPSAEEPKPLDSKESSPESVVRPSTTLTLTVYTLGTFQLAVNDTPTNHTIIGKSRTLFEYLLIHHEQPVARDVLMDVFWPNADPDSARNRLNVSLHHIRQALRNITDIPIVLFEEGAYCINPEFDLWIDAEEFDRHVRKGHQLEAAERLPAAIKEYELARDVYQGDFLADEPYEDWPVLTRERLRTDYLDMLDRLSRIYFDQGRYTDCVAMCQSILSHDDCREDAHCRLMQCYSRQNQRYLALRQYQVCVKALRTELDVEPASATTQMYERIRRRERV